MLKFILVTLAVSVSILGIVYLAAYAEWIAGRPSYLEEIIIFMVVSTIVIYRYLNKFINTDYFVHLFLASISIKLIASLAIITLMVIKDRSGAAPNIALFLMSYGIFTGVEIAFLYPRVSRHKKG